MVEIQNSGSRWSMHGCVDILRLSAETLWLLVVGTPVSTSAGIPTVVIQNLRRVACVERTPNVRNQCEHCVCNHIHNPMKHACKPLQQNTPGNCCTRRPASKLAHQMSESSVNIVFVTTYTTPWSMHAKHYNKTHVETYVQGSQLLNC